MKISNKEDYLELIKYLNENSSGEAYCRFQKKIIKTNKEIIGVKANVLRKLAKNIYNAGYLQFLEIADDRYFEVDLLFGFVVSAIKGEEESKKYLSCYLNRLDNWAVVDMVAGNLFFAKKSKDREKLFDYFCDLTKSDQEFICRFGIVCLMKYFLDDLYYERVVNVLDDVKCNKYYVNMAISWLLSELLIKRSQNAVEIMQKIIKNNHFNTFVLKKSIQKARESYRVDLKTKERLRELKCLC